MCHTKYLHCQLVLFMLTCGRSSGHVLAWCALARRTSGSGLIRLSAWPGAATRCLVLLAATYGCLPGVMIGMLR